MSWRSEAYSRIIKFPNHQNHIQDNIYIHLFSLSLCNCQVTQVAIQDKGITAAPDPST